MKIRKENKNQRSLDVKEFPLASHITEEGEP